ncbi:ABC transporter permease [Nocardioides sp. CBS4Y-1]|uniref:ABC transporter permease n=1 Tax=Nocardioides acrostichi TaxID=2784339 RepID=A0A930V0N1_9ACTN|nr:ABC transporter permease [Nocardioides acrostichi]
MLPQTQQLILIAFYSTLLVIAIAVPLGILLTRPAFRKIAPAVLAVANVGQATPAYGLLAVGLILLGQGAITVIYALAFFALLPVLRNTMLGLESVDRNVIEAGRGMGMTRLGILLRIELPLAVPVITAGVRTAMVINIGMATLAYTIAGGGLGITISSGLKLRQNDVVLVGTMLVALIALTFDYVGALLERFLKPKGI